MGCRRVVLCISKGLSRDSVDLGSSPSFFWDSLVFPEFFLIWIQWIPLESQTTALFPSYLSRWRPRWRRPAARRFAGRTWAWWQAEKSDGKVRARSGPFHWVRVFPGKGGGGHLWFFCLAETGTFGSFSCGVQTVPAVFHFV